MYLASKGTLKLPWLAKRKQRFHHYFLVELSSCSSRKQTFCQMKLEQRSQQTLSCQLHPEVLAARKIQGYLLIAAGNITETVTEKSKNRKTTKAKAKTKTTTIELTMTKVTVKMKRTR